MSKRKAVQGLKKFASDLKRGDLSKYKVTRLVKVKPVRAWAWLWEYGLCYWAEPDRKKLAQGGKPSPEAKPVLVVMMLESDYRSLLAQARQAKKGKVRRGS